MSGLQHHNYAIMDCRYDNLQSKKNVSDSLWGTDAANRNDLVFNLEYSFYKAWK